MNWEQLKTILWLRWRITRNQWAKSGGLGLVITTIVAVAMTMMGGMAFIAGILVGALVMGKVEPIAVMGVCLAVTIAFLFFWLVGLMAELQRSETIDIARLMHLPVALGQLFAVNYIVSHLAVSIILMVPAITGLALGLTVSRGPIMLLLLPLAWSMVFMITAWTYCLRGWLATMMSNPRRRRAIVMAFTMGVIVIAQAPNIYFNVFGGRVGLKSQPGETSQDFQKRRDAAKEATNNKLIAAQKFVPPLWLPFGAKRLAEGNALAALFGTLGAVGIGALGLHRAYRGAVRFYQGETGGRAAAPVLKQDETDRAPNRAGRSMLHWRLPGVPEPASVVALGTLRSLLRAPEVKMAWGTSFLVTIIIGGGVLFRSADKIPEAFRPFVITGALMFSTFMLVQFQGNQFGYDRDGFRAFVLSPVERRLILFGKNLAAWPVALFFGLSLIVMLSIWLRLSLLLAMAGLFQLVAFQLLASTGGNVLSILIPYRIEPGTNKPTKMPALAMFIMVCCQLLFPLVMLPVALPVIFEYLWHHVGGNIWLPINFVLSGLLAVLAVVLYWWSLGPLGQLLHRREIKILHKVTAGQE